MHPDLAPGRVERGEEAEQRPAVSVEPPSRPGTIDLPLRFAEETVRWGTGGVAFVGCENTMTRKNMTKDQLVPFALTVDSGVAEVIRKQEQGWSYIKSGL